MFALCFAVPFVLHALLVTSAPSAARSNHVTIPLRQRRSDKIDARAQTLHAVSKHSAGKRGFAIAPETLDGGFWYGAFSIGESEHLSLLVDSGSNDVAIDPGLYRPSPQSINLHEKGELQFATAQSNGCGFADIHYYTYADTVSTSGLTALNQTFAKVKKTPPPNMQTVSVFPHQGIVGFGGVKADQTQLGGVPFFQSLCNLGVVDECRFGLAYGTAGTGKQILGGVDASLFDGALHESAIDTSTGYTVTINGDLVYETPQGIVERFENQSILLDSGTSNVVGTAAKVQRLFEDLGIQAVNQATKACKGVLYGYYACDSPAKVGFTVGRETFYIEPSAFKLADNGDNNCTATITAVDQDYPFWIVGQSWFQGKYVDFQQPDKIGAATLKDKTCAS